jgi:DNA processing protein
MAALGDVTVVVEAADPSGSLITAAFALDLHRHVGAVPGRATCTEARGTNALIRDGSQVILGPDDVIALLEGIGRAPRRRRAPAPESELEPGLRAVLSAVERCDTHHELAGEAGLGPGPLRAALGRLELLGLVRRDELGGYVRTAR